MSNKKAGNDFEQEFAEILAENGYWVHRLNPNKSGQPFDIIAVKNGFAEAIDCKVCDKDVFDFSRIEDNQESAMKLWRECGNGGAYFALKASNGMIYGLSYGTVETLRKRGKTRIDLFDYSTQFNYLIEFDDWFDE